MSPFGVRKGAATEMAAAEKMGTLVLPHVRLPQAQSEASSCQGRGEWERQEVTDDRGRQHGSEEGHETSLSPVR